MAQAVDITEDKLRFVTFCVEMYVRRHGTSGEQALCVFDASHVCDFLVDEFDPLHSQGREAILDDIELFMEKAGGNANA